MLQCESQGLGLAVCSPRPSDQINFVTPLRGERPQLARSPLERGSKEKTFMPRLNKTQNNGDSFDRQGWHLANQLARIWASEFADGHLSAEEASNIKGIRDLSTKDKIALSSTVAKLSGVGRSAIRKIITTGWLPEIPTLVRIALALERKVVVEWRRPDQSARNCPHTIELSDPTDVMTDISIGLKSILRYNDLSYANTGVSKDTLFGAMEGLQVIKFESLFCIAKGLNYQLKIFLSTE